MPSFQDEEFVYPPVVPSTLEKLQDLATNLDRLSIHQLPNVLKAVEAPRDTRDLYQVHPTQAPFTLQFLRDPESGKILSYKEIEISSVGETAKNSLSLTRAPGTSVESVKGNSTNLPFWPGGFDDVRQKDLSTDIDGDFTIDETEIDAELFGTKDLAKSPPGLPMVSIEFADASGTDRFREFSSASVNEMENEINFWHVPPQPQFPEHADQNPDAGASKKESAVKRLLRDDFSIPSPANDEDRIKVPVLKISGTESHVSATKKQWAEMVDVTKPMTDFHERVPDMAFRYPFQLDTFQQQAICRLEEHENVFVAAHTSAGKTVVAEYAISLSVRHMTKTVYTSPIKALSNQKFRDFKTSFESVGLITGDVQINPTASCLIMTTEILRSMLYNGSDTIRDLEWVVFDEIHYLNNAERGHVWEEVLIMLPQHVSIIMLSATVPNALDFANWVGGIKKKKIYVISTAKRPVPLEHHLYTGTGGKSRNEQFRILDGASKFSKVEYAKAVDAKESRKSKHQQTFGPKGGQYSFNESFEKTLYVGLISHLKDSDKLPVVVFTFSRNKCDTYARMLSSVDLCTGAQKAEIHGFFQKSISRLKGSDRELPQVLTVQGMLKNGIGVHHSGILPILKEVVEMLFQKGLVKLLFATETFAMGVNMPARTVVFDSIRKHDGTQFRSLNAAEYIQMAGRAGRRGLDTTGTVLILCKQSVPSYMDLQIMMLGDAAKLSSQFRLTYSMILNLLRVETLSVEDVMKRSFLEAGSTTMNAEAIQQKLNKISQKLEELEFEPRDQSLSAYYNQVKEYLTTRDAIAELLYTHPKMAKDLMTGRFIVFETLPRVSPRVGLILQTCSIKENGKQVKKYKILYLTCTNDTIRKQDKALQILSFPGIELLEGHKIPEMLDRKFQLFLYYAHDKILEFQGDDVQYPQHVIAMISCENILHILDDNVRIDVDIIVNDVNKRLAPRFREDAPGPHTAQVLKQLSDLSSRYSTLKYSYIPLVPKLASKGMEPQMFENLKRLDEKALTVKQRDFHSEVPNFVQQFRDVFFYMRLVDEKDHLNYLLSPKSLRLHAEYKARIDVLRELGYIDGENLVQLKGRVACEMGNQNELMMTEIIFNNILSDCPPEEVAALLSCMVFEAKHVPEPKLPPDSRLRKKIEAIKLEARRIGEIQRSNEVTDSIDAFVEQFKFGLVEVVHEWAQGKPFANIMNLTEVQEGLIVRTIQRLDEMLKDVKDAARIIGDPTLKKKMEEASECIKRDIVFAASLYTQ